MFRNALIKPILRPKALVTLKTNALKNMTLINMSQIMFIEFSVIKEWFPALLPIANKRFFLPNEQMGVVLIVIYY
jgi:hypothetical protein